MKVWPVHVGLFRCGVTFALEESSSRPAKKKQKTALNKTKAPGSKQPAKGKGARLIGKLEGLMKMPVDVFSHVRKPCESASLTELTSMTQICQYLGPQDLLRLSQSSLRLREVLMTKDAKIMWQAALENYPTLPPCPSDLSEPQFVALMFCSTCQASPVHQVQRRGF